MVLMLEFIHIIAQPIIYFWPSMLQLLLSIGMLFFTWIIFNILFFIIFIFLFNYLFLIFLKKYKLQFILTSCSKKVYFIKEFIIKICE